MKWCRTDDDYRAKLQSQVKVSESGCWLWQGYTQRGNYGQMYYRGKCWTTHRLSHLLFKGPIPKGLGVCHSCDTKACCNPDHLWLGDQKANGRDLMAKGLHYTRLKTHCPHGHAYAEHGAKHGARGYRACKECNRLKWQRQSKEGPKGPRKPVTHCKYGHELAGDNLYLAPDGKRRCRKCQVRTVTRTMARYAQGLTATQRLADEAKVTL